MVDDGRLLRSMLDLHNRHGRSAVALQEVAPEEISSYGCVEPESEAVDGVCRDQARRREAAGRRSAVEPRSHRPVRVHRRDLRHARSDRARAAGGELQLTDAMALLLEAQSMFGVVCGEGRYDVGQKLDFLRANVELALDREDLGPPFAAWLREFVKERGLA